MRLATIQIGDERQAAVVIGERVVPIVSINAKRGTQFCTHLMGIIQGCDFKGLEAAASAFDPRDCVPLENTRFATPYDRPGKVWGIGLNYKSHAADLDAQAPVTHPASFMKPATAIIGAGEPICLPADIGRVTAEAELGVIIGKKCRNVPREQIGPYIFGYTSIIDMTALDILQQNPRYLTRAKSFDTFFSFGPVIITADEVPELSSRVIRTLINNRIIAENEVANMTFGPYELVSLHSFGMTLEPGDIISTGTPGAGFIQAGDSVRCEIDGFLPLENPVISEV